MNGFNKITEGLVKATMSLASRAGKNAKKRAEKPRYSYYGDGVAVHGKKYLSEKKRAEINVVLESYNKAETDDEKKDVLAKLAGFPVQLVAVRRQVKADRSRYTGERLREIRAAGGGKRERERRMRQRGTAPVALAA